jgi:hypothetical protein
MEVCLVLLSFSSSNYCFCYLYFSVNYSRPPPGVCHFSRDPSHFKGGECPELDFLWVYRFRRTGATAWTGLRIGPASLRCRLLSSVLLISSWDLRIQSGITRTRISSWTVTPLLFARSFSFKNIPRSRTCMNFTDSLPSRTSDQRPGTVTTRSGYTWLTYSS